MLVTDPLRLVRERLRAGDDFIGRPFDRRTRVPFIAQSPTQGIPFGISVVVWVIGSGLCQKENFGE